jgi:GAF domain-containing protein
MTPIDGEAAIDSNAYWQLTDNFSQSARLLFSAGSVTATLTQVLELAVATIDGCDFAGVFLITGDEITTPVRTDPIVNQVDALQQQAGEGPCLDAIAQRSIFYADDLLVDARWPEFGSQAAAKGMRSALALPLTTNGENGALNLYARYPAAFGALDRAKGVILASLAGLALSAARSHEDEEHQVDNLQSALSSREIIGQAQGILMERERISADEAFLILRRASQRLNIKLREVAQNLVETGESPEIPPAPDQEEPSVAEGQPAAHGGQEQAGGGDAPQ